MQFIRRNFPTCPQCHSSRVRFWHTVHRIHFPAAPQYRCQEPACGRVFFAPADYVPRGQPRNSTNPSCPQCGARTRRWSRGAHLVRWQGRRVRLLRYQCTTCWLSFTEKTLPRLVRRLQEKRWQEFPKWLRKEATYFLAVAERDGGIRAMRGTLQPDPLDVDPRRADLLRCFDLLWQMNGLQLEPEAEALPAEHSLLGSTLNGAETYAVGRIG